LVYSPGDLFGFLALGLIGLSSIFMILRGRVYRLIKNLTIIRSIHIAISLLAGIFMLLHIAYYYDVPISIGKLFGYADFATAIAVWLTGTAFLERLRGSLQFHGSLTILLISFALIHAAFAGKNFPLIYSVIAIGLTVTVALFSALYQSKKLQKILA
jgi:hypothetical protein